MADKRTTITPRENGPLVVKGLEELRGPDGAALEVKAVVALCRCGHSQNKPFCDGSHAKVGFTSTSDRPADGPDKVLRYSGTGGTVTYNPRLCAHAAECVRLAHAVFDPARKPWIDPDQGTADQIRDVVRACPSGALALEGPEHLLPEGVRIGVQKDGPYWVLRSHVDAPPPGQAACDDKVVLCRCGMSGNKPYCDGTHRAEKWSDD